MVNKKILSFLLLINLVSFLVSMEDKKEHHSTSCYYFVLDVPRAVAIQRIAMQERVAQADAESALAIQAHDRSRKKQDSDNCILY